MQPSKGTDAPTLSSPKWLAMVMYAYGEFLSSVVRSASANMSFPSALVTGEKEISPRFAGVLGDACAGGYGSVPLASAVGALMSSGSLDVGMWYSCSPESVTAG